MKDFTAKALPRLAGAAGLLGLVVLGIYVYLAGIRVLSQLEVVLFSVLVLILESAASVYVGVVSSQDRARREYQPFVRSALRRTYNLSETLERVQDSIKEGMRRMSTRTSFDQRAQTQLWAEILNLTHSQVNELLRQAEASIQDWREFGPEEAEKLEQIQREKAEKIADLTTRVQELYSVMNDLQTVGAGAGPTVDRLEKLAGTLERELEGVRSRSLLSSPDSESVNRGDTRKLMLMGAFEEAIEAYSNLIDLSPASHTLYIGRARAKYLAGDKRGAMNDLDTAEKLQPTDLSVSRLRQQIERGESLSMSVASGIPVSLAHAYDGNSALANGDVQEARRKFAEAEAAGLSPAFAACNRAMVELLAGNADAAVNALKFFDANLSGPFMRVQLSILYALCDAIAGRESDLELVRKSLRDCPDFSYNKCPVRFLQEGLGRIGRSNHMTCLVFQIVCPEAV